MKKTNGSVPRLPAPWTLRGHAFAFLVKMPEDVLDSRCFVAPELAGRRAGRFSIFMYVNYSSSNAGAYHELLFLPARHEFSGSKRWTISKIYVSGMETLVNGRENWGIPKEMADFDSFVDSSGIERVRASSGNSVFANMEFAPYGPSFPVTSSLLPSFIRTLAHYREGKLYTVTPRLRCVSRLARVRAMAFNDKFFPDVSRGTIMMGGYLGNFTAVFPEAKITLPAD
ncbi:MAG TPA: acetoacetate decarboxylase family protein [Spirochaetota bacterium]|nr:acetoacetate decarboxylase family protein [Spirochaetota bacterium]HPC39799.1 acetoacetate decarboxylase family protein [Spirochaetota bacterium]HPL17765.1 acetoacetate decarboxylase family protein [Spirochaetota bacterium]HQF09846.1 acetoacetate decarboxylase family protein [Spirochaetota bacterium]HQH98496.1 acetoacetate decarboxylase family protein [Spirochaetota bacterium]